jgi:hypothetical protein
MNTILIDGLNVKPGDFVVTQFSGYEHWSLVSDRLCEAGKYMLISATKRTGTVLEEAWDIVTGGKKTGVATINHTLSIDELLARARSQIGVWKYSVVNKNCEHFSNWAANQKVTSKQVVYALTTATIVTTAYTLISEKPKWALGIGILGLGLWAGTQLGKSTKKED